MILLLFFFNVLDAQTNDTILLKHNVQIAAKAQFYIKWGDDRYMELHPNGSIYQMKRGLNDGIYIATFDKELNWKTNIIDTAMVVTILNGKENGLLQRWDDTDKMITEECEYKDGLMNGFRKLYFFDPSGNKYINIEVYQDGFPVRTIQVEW
jgi:antitoxin component YwqK of YwqJK toxin-antitoxin module